jgi:hypothetical protein
MILPASFRLISGVPSARIEEGKVGANEFGLGVGKVYSPSGFDFQVSESVQVRLVELESKPFAKPEEAIVAVRKEADEQTYVNLCNGLTKLAADANNMQRFSTVEELYSTLKKSPRRIVVSDELAGDVRELFTNKLAFIHDSEVELVPKLSTRQIFEIPAGTKHVASVIRFDDEKYEVTLQNGMYVAKATWTEAVASSYGVKIKSYAWG